MAFPRLTGAAWRDGLTQLSADAGPAYVRLLLATVLLAGLLLLWGLGDIALLSYNEARRALPAMGMYHSGDWLLPRINGEPYLSKPPLLYWVSAGLATLFGTASEWAVRLPSALAAGALLWGCYRYARRVFGPWPALFTLQLLLANVGFSMFARRAEIEMLLTALCAGALLAALSYLRGDSGRGWLRLSYLLLGLAVLAKGPLALLFVTLPLLAYATYSRAPRAWQALGDLPGWGIFLAVGLSWYALVTWRMGPEVWLPVIGKDITGKIHGEAGSPFYMYLQWIAIDFFPASLLLLAYPVATWRRWKLQPDCVAMLLAVCVPLLVYSLFSDKHPKYLLPLYPFLAMLLGKRLAELMAGSGVRLRRLILTLGVALPAAYAGYYGFAEARVLAHRVAALPQIAAWFSTMPSVPVYSYGVPDERLLYYAGRDLPVVDAGKLAHLRASGDALLLLVEQDKVAEAGGAAGCRIREFRPYLKRKGVLTVYGYGRACRDLRQRGNSE